MALLNPVFITGAVEGVTDEIVVRRLIQHVGANTVVVHVQEGKMNLHARIQGYNQAAAFAPWFVLVDLDNDAACAPVLRGEWLPHLSPQMCFRVAVRTMEAWLLADSEALAAYLGVPRKRLPANPEGVDRPKRAIVDLAVGSRRKRIRADMVPRSGSGREVGPGFTGRIIEFVRDHWRPEVAEGVSPSLASCIGCLRHLLEAG